MYAKLFSRITESSLMEQEIPVRYTFVMLLAIADPSGLVVGTDIAIARRLNMPLAEFERCMAALNAPDEDSNSKEQEGRRVIPSEGERGYQVVNYLKYKGFQDEQTKRNYMRNYMRDYRQKKEPVKVGKELLDSPSASPYGSSSSSSYVEKGGSGETKKRPSFETVKLAMAKTGLPESDAVWFWNKCEGNGWKVNGKPIASWPHVIGSWKSAGYMPSKKNGQPPKRNVDSNQLQETVEVRTLCTKPSNKPPAG